MTQERNTTQIWNHLGHEVRDFVLWLVGGDPASLSEGKIWWDTVAHRAKVRTNSATKTLAHTDELSAGMTFDTPGSSAVGDTVAAGSDTDAARADHRHGREAFAAPTAQTAFGGSSATGTNTTVPHSDHAHGTPTHDAAAHSAIKLSDLAAPTAQLNIGGQKLTNGADATADTDFTTLGQMNTLFAGLKWKSPDAVAKTTGNITLSGAQTIDGVSVVAGNRVVVGSQTTGTENGLYLAASGAWTRTTDADTAAELQGAAVTVSGGTVNADSAWYVSTDAITIGSTVITWAPFPGGGAITGGAGLTKTGNSVDVGQGTGIVVNANDVAIDTASVSRYVTGSLGNGTNTTFAITHSFGRKIVKVTVSDTTDDSEWDVGVTFTSTSVVTLDFGATVPTTNQFTYLVQG